VILAAVALAGCQSTPLPAFDPADGRVTIKFQAQEDFTDARDRANGETAPYLLDQLAQSVQQEVRRALRPGERFAITFTDIDLAGDYEPWRRPGLDDVRIVKDIYPPRLQFSYRLTDADGNAVSEGKEELLDLAFSMRSGIGRDQPLYYEKGMLRDWVRRTLPPR
jgi:Protein of unknown function (DUF3016)